MLERFGEETMILARDVFLLGKKGAMRLLRRSAFIGTSLILFGYSFLRSSIYGEVSYGS